MPGEIPVFPAIDAMVQVLHLRQKNAASAALVLCSKVRAL